MARVRRKSEGESLPEISFGAPVRRTVRKRADEPHPLGAPGSRHRSVVNFDDSPAPVVSVQYTPPVSITVESAPIPVASAISKADPGIVVDVDKARMWIQSLIFNKGTFKSLDQAVAWAKKAKFATGDHRETAASFRLRQRPPEHFIKGTFKVKPLTAGVTAVMGHLLPKFEPKPKTKSAELPVDVAKFVVRRGSKWFVLDHLKKKVLGGPYDTKPEAEARLRAIEYFKHKKAAVPDVLTWDAVRKNRIPDLGDPGMPASLAADVPPRFRFWKCSSATDAILVREALVEAELFTEDTLQMVNGELRRVVAEPLVKLYLAPTYADGEPVVPAARRAVEKAAALLADSDRTTTLFDENVTGAIGIGAVLEHVAKLQADWIAAVQDSEAVRKAIHIPAFKLRGRGDLLFVTNAELAEPDGVEWVIRDRADSVMKFAMDHQIRLVKSETEERIVYGVVLEPDEVDAQNDTITKAEIRSAAYKFMESFQVSGVQHQDFAEGRLKILESWIAPADFTIGNETVKEGSWIMTKRVVDDDLWAGVKSGAYTGFSIGGSAIRKPIES